MSIPLYDSLIVGISGIVALAIGRVGTIVVAMIGTIIGTIISTIISTIAGSIVSTIISTIAGSIVGSMVTIAMGTVGRGSVVSVVVSCLVSAGHTIVGSSTNSSTIVESLLVHTMLTLGIHIVCFPLTEKNMISVLFLL